MCVLLASQSESSKMLGEITDSCGINHSKMEVFFFFNHLKIFHIKTTADISINQKERLRLRFDFNSFDSIQFHASFQQNGFQRYHRIRATA